MAKAPFNRILHVDDQPDIRGIVKLAGWKSLVALGSKRFQEQAVAR